MIDKFLVRLLGRQDDNMESDLMTIDLSNDTPTPEKDLIKSSRIVSREYYIDRSIFNKYYNSIDI